MMVVQMAVKLALGTVAQWVGKMALQMAEKTV